MVNGFQSDDDIINAITVLNQSNTVDCWKVSAAGTYAVGRWLEYFSSGGGIPSIGVFSGTAGVATVLNSSTVGAIPLIEGNVSPKVRSLFNMSAYAATAVQSSLLLCDFLLYYPALVVTGTPTTLNNTATLPRYTNGVGVQAFVAVKTTIGAATPSLTITYTANDNSSHTATMALSANGANVSQCFGDNVANDVFFPVPSGLTGIKSINSYTISSGTTGTVSIVLCYPIVQVPFLNQNLFSERDAIFQAPSLPIVQDDSCLGFMMNVGSTGNLTILSRVQYGWK